MTKLEEAARAFVEADKAMDGWVQKPGGWEAEQAAWEEKLAELRAVAEAQAFTIHRQSAIIRALPPTYGCACSSEQLFHQGCICHREDD